MRKIVDMATVWSQQSLIGAMAEFERALIQERFRAGSPECELRPEEDN
jgi:hypothetical protein